MYNIKRKTIIVMVIVLVALIVGTRIACRAGRSKPVAETESGTFLTVREGAIIHSTDDVTTKKNKVGSLWPGIEAKIVDRKVIAYKIITRGTPQNPSMIGWIYAELVASITNR